jgi:uncharacterized membrane protein HdeD (DUF308 family)
MPARRGDNQIAIWAFFLLRKGRRRATLPADSPLVRRNAMPSDATMPLGFGRVGLEKLQESRGTLIALGVLMILIGILAIGSAAWATVVSVLFFGWLLFVGGCVQFINAFMSRHWHGWFVPLLGAILQIVVGLLIVRHPIAGELTLTLLLAAGFLVSGIFRIVAGIAMDLPHRGWVFLNGLITLVLGVLIWRQWPLSGLWVIGLFIGIDLLFGGWTCVTLGLAIRKPAAPANT